MDTHTPILPPRSLPSPNTRKETTHVTLPPPCVAHHGPPAAAVWREKERLFLSELDRPRADLAAAHTVAVPRPRAPVRSAAEPGVTYLARPDYSAFQLGRRSRAMCCSACMVSARVSMCSRKAARCPCAACCSSRTTARCASGSSGGRGGGGVAFCSTLDPLFKVAPYFAREEEKVVEERPFSLYYDS
jgi:hypothetical protein